MDHSVKAKERAGCDAGEGTAHAEKENRAGEEPVAGMAVLREDQPRREEQVLVRGIKVQERRLQFVITIQ